MSKKKFDVTSLGEILIDFTYCGKNAEGKNIFEENPGGAPANCSAAVAKLGGKSAFIGMTGEDSFGKNLRTVLNKIGVDTSAMRITQKQHTTLAFVTIDENGERSFSFCRNPGADTQISTADLDKNLLENSRILHIGSLSLTDEPSKASTFEAIRIVKNAGGLISYDPNWRKNLWRGRTDSMSLLKSLMPYSDIVKVSEEELFLLFGDGISYADGAKLLMQYGVKLVFITLGSAGVYYAVNSKNDSAKTFYEGTVSAPDVKVIDTTGAGDSFTGGMLYRITRRENPLEFTEKEIISDLNFAVAVASICVTRRGAIPALPTNEETLKFMQEHNTF